MLASITKLPELELQEDEAKRLAIAAANVAKYYDVAIDAKTQAWFGLISVAGQIYGTRAIAIYTRNSREKKTASEGPRPLSQVMPFPNG